jgi:hypothetical protein
MLTILLARIRDAEYDGLNGRKMKPKKEMNAKEFVTHVANRFRIASPKTTDA